MVHSEPFFSLEKEIAQNAGQNTDGDHIDISVVPGVFGHGEIHAVPSDDQRQRQKNAGDDGEDFHDLVLLDIDLCLIGLSDLGGILAQMQNEIEKIPDAAVQGGIVLYKLRGQYSILVSCQRSRDETHLLVVALQPEEIPPERDNPRTDAPDRFPGCQNAVLKRGDGILQLFQNVQIFRGKGEKKTEKLLEGSAFGRDMLQNLNAALIYARENKFAFTAVDTDILVLFGSIPHVAVAEFDKIGSVLQRQADMAGRAHPPVEIFSDVIFQFFSLAGAENSPHGPASLRFQKYYIAKPAKMQ
ncbi:hypothetical protein SDC9_68933 [bioreactor metagenome]|uniref:Uncharacterized protein n=1 Tax=bioreactor metagenome TaxID=1076179 RepID=A0A644Y3A6_9ZZZZ